MLVAASTTLALLKLAVLTPTLMFWPAALIKPALFRVPAPAVVISWLSAPLKRTSPLARLLNTAPLLSTVTWPPLGWLRLKSPELLRVTLSKYTSLSLPPVMVAVAPTGINSVPPPTTLVLTLLRASMPMPPLTVRVLPELRVSVLPADSVAAPLTVRSRSTIKAFALKLMGAPKIVEPVPAMVPPSLEKALATLNVPAPVSNPPVCE